MAKSVIEQLSELDSDLGAKIKEVIKAHPKLAADDRQMSELFGFYLGAEEPATTPTPAAEPAAAVTVKGTPEKWVKIPLRLQPPATAASTPLFK